MRVDNGDVDPSNGGGVDGDGVDGDKVDGDGVDGDGVDDDGVDVVFGAVFFPSLHGMLKPARCQMFDRCTEIVRCS